MIRVTAIDPNVSTSAVKLRVGVQVASPLVSAAVSYARATEYHVDLVVSASGQILASELDYILLNVGAYLDTSGLYQFRTDIALVQDAVVVATGKALADTYAVSDSTTAAIEKYLADAALVLDSSTLVDGIEYGIEKRDNETLAVSDLYAGTFIKPVLETLGVQDDSTFAVDKAINDLAPAVDVFASVLAWSRSFSELQTADSAEYKGVALQNPIEISSRYVVAGYVRDGYVAVDSVFTDDALGVMIQSYVSGDFFAEDYVGATFGPY
jgi:hypothetical protein